MYCNVLSTSNNVVNVIFSSSHNNMDGQLAQMNELAIWDAHFVDILFFAVC